MSLSSPGQHPNYPAIAEHCNLWRNFDDITDSWDSVLSIIDFYGKDEDGFSAFAGPGKWNDPDMLIIGNFGLSLDQVALPGGGGYTQNPKKKKRRETKNICENSICESIVPCR
jgi:hypothetical protein